MIQPKNETEDLFLSITENCETVIKQTQTKPQVVLEFKINRPKQTISFNPLISVEGSWMIGLTSLEVCNSIFNITEQINKLEIYIFPVSKTGGLHMKKSKMSLKKTWMFPILQPPIYKMKY